MSLQDISHLLHLKAMQFELHDPLHLALTALVAVLVYVLIRTLKSSKLPPGPRWSLPIFGDAISIIDLTPVKFFWKRYKQYGPTFKVNLMGTPLYVITQPETLRSVLKDDGARFVVPSPAFKMLMEDISLMSNTTLHPIWRKLMILALGPLGTERAIPQIQEIVERHVGNWAAKGQIPLYSSVSAVALDLAIDVISGVKITHANPQWVREKAQVFFQGLYGFPINLPGTPLYKALKAKEELCKAVQEDLRSHVTDVTALVAQVGTDASDILSAFQTRESAPNTIDAQIASMLMYRDIDLRQGAILYLHNVMAGGDTTRTAAATIVATTAMSPRVQQAMFEEQQRVLAEHGPGFHLRVVNSMTYLDAVIKESMRLLPVGQGGMRLLVEDLHVGTYVIPKGQYVWYQPNILHAIDPALWDGNLDGELPPHMDWKNKFAESFRPERWLSDDTKPKHYFTFGQGAHQCLGMNFVHVELKMLMAVLVRDYTWTLADPDMLSKATIFPMLVPKDGSDNVILKRRAYSD